MLKCISFFVAAMLVFTTPALATSIGVFNSQIIASRTEPSKAAQQILKNKFGSERSSLEKQDKELQTKYESFQKQAATLSQQAREKKQMEIMRKGREFEEKRRAFMGRVERETTMLQQNIGKIIFEASANVAKKKDLDLILDAAVPGIMYVTEKMDLTDDMVKEVNRIWKSMGSKFPAASNNKRN